MNMVDYGWAIWGVVLTSVITALLAVRWVYFRILCLAKEKQFVDNPNARKLQKEPIPLMGGIAVFFGVVFGMMVGYIVGNFVGFDFHPHLMPILAAMVVMLYTGALDDAQGLSPLVRLAIEVLVMLGLIFASNGCIDSFHGLWGIETFSWWLGVPLTVVAGVGIINAVNMIDGVNGLSSSLCMLCCILYGSAFVHCGDIDNAVLAFSVAAALLPFMIHNVFGLRSRMFIGDAGTMVMGLLMTWFTMSLLRSDGVVTVFHRADKSNMIAFALAALSVPVFDVFRVMAMRILHHRSPFSPDRTHLHHVFVSVGFSHFVITLIEVLLTALSIIVWSLSVTLGASFEMQLYIVVAMSVLLVWGIYVWIHYHTRHHTETLHRLVAYSIHTHMGRTQWWKKFTAWLDAPEDRLVYHLKQSRDEEPDSVVVPLDPDDAKAQDRKRIFDFMNGRAEVLVSDIIRNSGADRFRVYAILHEEVQRGRMRVVRSGFLGAPQIVAQI